VSTLDVEGLQVRYAGREGLVMALADFALHVPQGRLTILLGESGCGKSTALNAMAGLVEPNAGRIRLGDSVLFDGDGPRRRINLPPNLRDIGMVFQSYALWPHLTVLANVLYPLRRRGIGREEAERAARAALATVRCERLSDRYPGELSGGQQQRIALARALVARPKLLLFDEPLSNLDAGLRRDLRDELARLHQEIGFTGVYVTHDQSEALALGTDVAVMDGGRVLQSGTPEQLYEQPASVFVARFFGANVVPGQVAERSGPGGCIATPVGLLDARRLPETAGVTVAFMPQSVIVEAAEDGPLLVTTSLYLGSHREMRLAAKGCDILAMQPADCPAPGPGTRVRIRIAADRVHAYAAS
jgi:iron(III) transport system ATP-binding protein